MKSDITVVIPAYNTAATILRALDSVLMQTRRPSEVIVVDDGSQDDTAEQAGRHPLGEFITMSVIRKRNGGVSAARNIGICAARTGHVAFLDADDEFTPEHLQTAEAAIKAHPAAAAYWAAITRVFDNDSPACRAEMQSLPDFAAVALRHICEDMGGGRYVLGDSLFNDLIRGNFIQPSSAVVKRVTRGTINLFNERARFAEDRLFFLELLHKGDGVFTDRPTAIVHRDGNNTSVTTDRSKALAINERVLFALEQARDLDAIARYPQRLQILNECLGKALRERVYFASFAGLGMTAGAISRASSVQAIGLRKDPVFIAKNVGRALVATMRA